MSEILNYISSYCREGVEYRPLSSVLHSISTGLNPRKNFRLNTDDAENYYVTVKEFTSGKIVFNEKTDRINDDAVSIIQRRSRLEQGDLLLSGIGTIGKVALVDIPVGNWNCSESVFLLKPNTKIIDPVFLKYILQGNEVQNVWNGEAVGSTLRGIRRSTLEALEIPVPPLEAQRKIVEVLDNFSELTAELTAELAARQKQYEYYRDNLLSFNNINRGGQNEVKWLTIGDIGEVKMCKRIMKNQTNTLGGVPFYKIGTFGKVADSFISEDIYKRYKQLYSFPKIGDILISASGTIGRSVVYNGEDSYFQDSNIVWVDNNEAIVLNSYLRYLYQIIEWKVEGGTIKRLYNDNLKSTPIAVPSIKEQRKIVGILDKFERLTTDLTEGLPAEIKARQQQYEYYRDKLLTFRRKAC